MVVEPVAVDEVRIDVVAVATGVERSGVGARLACGTPENGLVGLTGERVIILRKDKGSRQTRGNKGVLYHLERVSISSAR